MSGQMEASNVTPAAAISTPKLAKISFREHSHVERMFKSSALWRYKRKKQKKFPASASAPTNPMVSGEGTVPEASFKSASTRTPTPNNAIMEPLRAAAPARHF